MPYIRSIRSIPAALIVITLCICLFACAGTFGTKHDSDAGGARSPSALAVDAARNRLYIAETDAQRIDIFDTEQNTLAGSITLTEKPNGIVLSPDGTRIYVTCGEESGTVLAVDTNSGKTLLSADAGHTPMSPVISPDGGTLYVCARFTNRIFIFDTGTFELKHTTPALREPVAADISPDGRYLFIANHLPSGETISDYVTDGGVYMIGQYYSSGYFNTDREAYVFSAVVLVYDTAYRRLVDLIKLPNGSTGMRGITVSPDGKHVYVTHVLARYHVPTTQLERGWINTNALSVIDAEKMKFTASVLLDDLDRGAANPWGVTCTDDGSQIIATHAGTHELSIIDRSALHDRLDAVASGIKTQAAARTLDDVANDLSFLYGIRKRITLDGNGPRAVVTSGSDIYTALYYSDSINTVSRSDNGWDVTPYTLSPETALSEKRRGEMYFNDARLCFQNWQSCASCHPDGRADGLNWDLLNDGIGNPKNTKSLLLSHATPPVMALGVRADAETAVRAGLTHIQFVEKPDDIARAIDTYLKAMTPLKSPYLENGRLSRTAKNGRKVFDRAGCAECHPSPLYTDLESYAVGTGAGGETDRLFDTPALAELWRTGPYLNDGRADTMYDVLMKHNKNDQHGVTSTLSPDDLSDLLDYLLSL